MHRNAAKKDFHFNNVVFFIEVNRFLLLRNPENLLNIVWAVNRTSLPHYSPFFWPRVKRKTENRSVNSQKCSDRHSGSFYLSLFRLAAVTPTGAF
jgi:hypothetical protein